MQFVDLGMIRSMVLLARLTRPAVDHGVDGAALPEATKPNQAKMVANELGAGRGRSMGRELMKLTFRRQ